MPGLRRRTGMLLTMLCVVFAVALTGMRAPAQAAYTSVVVFGDSLSDTGNIANLTQSQFKVRYPADNTLFGFDYTDGRFTDGTDTQPAASKAYVGVWVEQLAALFGGKVTIKDSLDGGTDYAYGDATTADGTTVESRMFAGQTISITLDNMGQQVTNYLGTTPTPNGQTLYVLWGGANDLLNAAENGQDPVAAATTAAKNEIALVQRLYAAGATDFLLPNLPPLGAFAASYGPAAVTALNTASVTFAQTLAAGLATFQQGSMNSSLHVYQPDILTLFATVAANPEAVGLGDVATAADTVKVSPDTFLIWDGLHPTTTGHHLVAATAANLLSPLKASSATLSVPAAAIAGQSVTVSAAAASSQSGTTPTGLVTFFSGATVAGSAALDATGHATVSVTPTAAAGGSYTLSAVYAGDIVNNASTSAAASIAILSAAVGTTTTVTSSNLSADLGASVTFTAAVAPAVTSYGVPAGTVTFLDGTTTLGTGTLDGTGTATYTTTSLAAGTHSITAVYAAMGLFGGSTSAAITETVTAPTFTAVAAPTTLTVSGGGSGQVKLSATSVAGFNSNVSVGCQGLPAHFACSFDTATLSFGSGATTSNTATLTISTNAATTTPEPVPATRQAALGVAQVVRAGLILPAAAVLLGVGLRRRRRLLQRLLLPAVLAVLASGALLGVAGCGSSNNAPSGTYTVAVVFTPVSVSNAASVRPHLAIQGQQTVTVTVTVQ